IKIKSSCSRKFFTVSNNSKASSLWQRSILSITITTLSAKMVLFSAVLNQLPAFFNNFGFVIFRNASIKAYSNCSGAKVFGSVIDILYSTKASLTKYVKGVRNIEIIVKATFESKFIFIIGIQTKNNKKGENTINF